MPVETFETFVRSWQVWGDVRLNLVPRDVCAEECGRD